MEFPINASYINDFMFCPYSIMIHSIYEDMPKVLYQTEAQMLGSYFHRIDDEEFLQQMEDGFE